MFLAGLAFAVGAAGLGDVDLRKTALVLGFEESTVSPLLDGGPPLALDGCTLLQRFCRIVEPICRLQRKTRAMFRSSSRFACHRTLKVSPPSQLPSSGLEGVAKGVGGHLTILTVVPKCLLLQ